MLPHVQFFCQSKESLIISIPKQSSGRMDQQAALNTKIETGVLESLRSNGIAYEVISCSPEYADTSGFCSHYNYPMENCGNTLVVVGKGTPKRFAACVVRASGRLDVNHKVRFLMGVRRVSFASSDETQEITNMRIGGVTVFGLPPNLPVYLDRGLLELDYIIVGSGTRYSKLKLNPTELEKIPGASFIDQLII